MADMADAGAQYEHFLEDLRELVKDCFEGVRRQDPPEAWQPRLARIAELSARLESLSPRSYPPENHSDDEV